MVADVCLGKVETVAAREVSRFARNSREWQQLVEICRPVDTLLIDQDVIYARRLSNDRPLLGLRGSLNKYELDVLRQRSLKPVTRRLAAANWVVSAPVGFLKTEDRRLEMDPDRGVQERVRVVFRKSGPVALIANGGQALEDTKEPLCCLTPWAFGGIKVDSHPPPRPPPCLQSTGRV